MRAGVLVELMVWIVMVPVKATMLMGLAGVVVVIAVVLRIVREARGRDVRRPRPGADLLIRQRSEGARR